MKSLRPLAYVAWVLGVAPGATARAPLVSLTVSILSNRTDAEYQATFDRSDYAYPLPQTGLNTFGFAGELYVPAAAACADEVIGRSARTYPKPEHANGIVFLPYRSCRTEWEQLLHAETAAGRAAGALLYSLKDDAAQAAERAVVDLTHVHAPVWMVNEVAGRYLALVMRALGNRTAAHLPSAPASVELSALKDAVRLAVHAAIADTDVRMPRAFVTISRSAADVATADRNFFLKAMIGVGITGIVCFVVALVVRYFDCMRVTRRWDAPAWDGPPPHGYPQFARAKRVLRQHELDAMPCSVVTEGYFNAINTPPAPAHVRCARSYRSCPQLVPNVCEGLELHRIYSVQHNSMQDNSIQDAGAALKNESGWDAVECAICLEELRIGDVVRRLPCPHMFHTACIDRWLLFQSSVCPLCKRETTTPLAQA
ncbi:hypothetical protein IWW50_000051 [Coemansia erecta]|nr:hypothetical protein GGF43_000172 [Coemansia sp. RSA 2618]KAJ2830830.1 hypothetical protein IWW50_000051 [Coemansia erecta]